MYPPILLVLSTQKKLRRRHLGSAVSDDPIVVADSTIHELVSILKYPNASIQNNQDPVCMSSESNMCVCMCYVCV